jgi:hypothetical protein
VCLPFIDCVISPLLTARVLLVLVIFLGVVDEDPKVIYQAHNAHDSHTRPLQLIEGSGSIVYSSLNSPKVRKARHSNFGRIEFPSLARLPHLNWAPLYIPSASYENLERDYSLVELGLNYHLSIISLFNIFRHNRLSTILDLVDVTIQGGRQDEVWTFNT